MADAQVQPDGPLLEAEAEAPRPVVMLDPEPSSYFANTKSQLVKQKLDLVQLCCQCCKGNRYRIVQTPEGWGEDQKAWDEEAYDITKNEAGKQDKNGSYRPEMMTAKEESSWACKLCCGPWRELTMDVRVGEYYRGKDNIWMRFYRPCKCPINLICCELCSPEMSVQKRDGTELGKARHAYKCSEDLCGKKSWAIEDSNGTIKYYIQDNTCPCTSGGCANLCAPSYCCPLRTMKILDADKQELPEGYNADGELVEEHALPVIQNVFNCNCLRLCVTGLDQYRITYPEKATPEDKALLLAGLFLIEFTMFEHTEDGNDESNGIDF